MWTALYPLIMQVVALVATTAVSAALVAFANAARAKMGTEAGNAAMTMLHQALTTGVAAAQAASPGATPATVIDAAIKHAEASIPDTLAKLNPASQVLVNIAMSKLVK